MCICLDKIPQHDRQTGGRNWKNNITLCKLCMLKHIKQTFKGLTFLRTCHQYKVFPWRFNVVNSLVQGLRHTYQSTEVPR